MSIRQEPPGARPKGASLGAEGDSLTIRAFKLPFNDI